MGWWLNNDSYSFYAVDENENRIDLSDFVMMVQLAVSQSYEERLRDANH